MALWMLIMEMARVTVKSLLETHIAVFLISFYRERNELLEFRTRLLSDPQFLAHVKHHMEDRHIQKRALTLKRVSFYRQYLKARYHGSILTRYVAKRYAHKVWATLLIFREVRTVTKL